MFQRSLRAKYLMKCARTSQRILAAMSRDVCRDVPEVIEGQVPHEVCEDI